jgi:hypothetical protein
MAQAKDREAAVNAAVEAWRAQHPGEDVPYYVEDRVEKEWAARIPRPPLKSLIDHIDHIAKVAGTDHVGLGSDFDGVSSLPEGIDSVADIPKITAELMKRGYTAQDMRKILGGNIMRVFRQVEAVSKQMQAEEAHGKSSAAQLEEQFLLMKGDSRMTLDDIVTLLDNGLPPLRIVKIVQDKGVDFHLDHDGELRVRNAGGDNTLVNAINANFKKPE